MADIFSMISWIAFGLAGVCVVTTIALFFALNTRAAYLELKGQPQKKWASVKQSKNKQTEGSKVTIQQEIPTNKLDSDDEAVTTLDSGEAITTISLMNVYEPGTEIMEEDTETVTEIETNPSLVHEFYEETKPIINQVKKTEKFTIIRKKVIVHSNELLK